MDHPFRSAAVVLSALALLTAAGCESGSPRQTLAGSTGSLTSTSGIVIDGLVDEWPQDVAVGSDEHYLYLRTKIEQSDAALQAANESLVIWLDVDSNAATGLTPTGARDLESMGVDLAIEFSPRSSDGPRGGVRVSTYTAGGTANEISPYDLGLHFAPTYASEWTEMRVERRGDVLPALTAAGTARGAYALFDSEGELIGWSDPFQIEMQAGSPPPPVTADIPDQPEGTVRIMAWNALRDAPTENPGPFARVFQAIDPDIILIQEWDKDAAAMESWFNRTMGAMPGQEGVTWSVRDSAAWGVAIASKHPIQPLGPDSPEPRGTSRHPTRFVGALVVTPVGDVAAGSIHLKCCGAADSSEDHTRRAEALYINDVFGQAADAAAPGAIRVLGGDLNLVGSRQPLDALRTGLDENGMALEVADARVLGDSILATWGQDTSRYSAGRLDWILFGDHSADLINAFVLDTSRLSDVSLARSGLDRTDTQASDHDPIVVDLKPARGW